jgi:hypothetical protein
LQHRYRVPAWETIRPQKQLKEVTLDPVDRPEFRQFAHQVLDGHQLRQRHR